MISNIVFGVLFGTRRVSWGVVMQEVVRKLVSGLEKGKPPPINPYFFHLYNRFECLREEETTLLVVAKVMLQFNIAAEPEVQLEMKDADFKRELLGSKEIQKLTKVSSNSRRKLTYLAIDGKTTIQVSN